jgi:transposase InsO family protein
MGDVPLAVERSCGEATTALRDWDRVYNHERFSLALSGRTPAEKLADVLEAA